MLEDRISPAFFNVTSTVDSASLTSGSLRAAILLSDSTAGPNTINVPASTYKLTLSGITHDGKTGALQINTNSVNINAQGGAVVIDANSIDRVFDIEGSGLTVNFNGLTITGGVATTSSNKGDQGGAVYDAGSALSLTNVNLVKNTAGTNGGGIDVSSGSLTISGSTFTNDKGNTGGAVYFKNTKGNLKVTNSTFGGAASGQRNAATGAFGGALYVDAAGATFGNITVVGNIAQSIGGGISGKPLFSSFFSKNTIFFLHLVFLTNRDEF